MDDDEEERDFSKGIVYGFFEQAESTFEKMEKAFSKKDYGDLSQLGHFLKGSSATLGLIKVRDSCEKLQHCKEEILEKGEGAEREKADEDIQSIIKGVREDYKEVAALLRRFFGEEPAPNDEEPEAKSPKSEKK
ncbi:signal transduction histidine kinase [Talaromyces proteolyticus]|uniref:Signal transduction histidine kinase n=1 Tax=Talaromyces proteolyticus TaxID=1131652 RepID=A0AAD4KPX4_9EURO|nr:signal transduction histidine kinase [Talaromyces proteolyticus]KAH8697717.1 signal transduction histidine kinase [Talaromyces proteolyticus]